MSDILKRVYSQITDDPRISEYKINEELFSGDHFAAFSISSDDFKKDYSRLRYITCNFAGLISKVIADMLFGEPITIQDPDNQDFIDGLVFENKLDTLFYEHSIANSYFGDNIFKIRVINGQISIGDTPPALYFPELDPSDARALPKKIHLAWIVPTNGDNYLVVETHEPPFVRTTIGRIDKKDSLVEVDVDAFNKLAGTSYQKEVDTKINRYLVKHVPNWKTRGHFGISDFVDLKPLFFALNNRMTKTDNILDKHSDPILAVPEGVLDENGKVSKDAFTLFEIPESGEKPEYIVWNANLDNAFKQIDKMVEFLFMFSETSPDSMGMGKGGSAESGRALKLKLLRTIAKRNRKKLYYDEAIKDLIYTAELLAQANGFTISKDMNAKPTKPQLPDILWQDGIVNDEVERTDIVIKKVEAGIESKQDAIMELDEVDEDTAKETLKTIDDEAPETDFTSFVDQNGGARPPVNNKGGKPGEKKKENPAAE